MAFDKTGTLTEDGLDVVGLCPVLAATGGCVVVPAPSVHTRDHALIVSPLARVRAGRGLGIPGWTTCTPPSAAAMRRCLTLLASVGTMRTAHRPTSSSAKFSRRHTHWRWWATSSWATPSTLSCCAFRNGFVIRRRCEPPPPRVIPRGRCCRRLTACIGHWRRASVPISAGRPLVDLAQEFDAAASTAAAATAHGVVRSPIGGRTLLQLRVFDFDSALQRMSVIAWDTLRPRAFVALKGAPEMVASLCDPKTGMVHVCRLRCMASARTHLEHWPWPYADLAPSCTRLLLGVQSPTTCRSSLHAMRKRGSGSWLRPPSPCRT